MWMVDGRRRDEWERLSHLLAMIHNVQVSDKSKCVSPIQLNPFTAAKAKRNRATISDPGILARMMGQKVDDDAERAKRRAARRQRAEHGNTGSN